MSKKLMYYIFGSKYPNIKASTKNAEFVSDNISDAITKFDHLVSQACENNYYLICDFGVLKSTPFYSDLVRDETEIMPFLIIGEWHLGQDQNTYIRDDLTQVVKGNFVHEFSNNLQAIREIEYCLNSGRWFEFNILYCRNENRNGVKLHRVFTRKICTYEDILNRQIHKLKFSKRFILRDDYEWCPLPKSESKFYNFDIKKNEFKVI